MARFLSDGVPRHRVRRRRQGHDQPQHDRRADRGPDHRRAGRSSRPGTRRRGCPRFAVARYGSGGLDPSFGNRGLQPDRREPRAGDIAYGIAERPTAAAESGYAATPAATTGASWARRAGSSRRDVRATTAIVLGTGFGSAYGVAIQPNGRFVVVGRARGRHGRVRRGPADGGGGPDSSFGERGRAFTDFFGGEDTARAVPSSPTARSWWWARPRTTGCGRMAMAR